MHDTFPTPRRPFTVAELRDRPMVLKLLRFEDALMLGPESAKIYNDPSIPHLTSLETFYILHRATLAAHGFNTTDEDVANYRKIFSHYYNGPHDYDAEVLGAVAYMRENKCVYYKSPPINVGEKAPDVPLQTITGIHTSLYKVLAENHHEHVFVGAFSNS